MQALIARNTSIVLECVCSSMPLLLLLLLLLDAVNTHFFVCALVFRIARVVVVFSIDYQAEQVRTSTSSIHINLKTNQSIVHLVNEASRRAKHYVTSSYYAIGVSSLLLGVVATSSSLGLALLSGGWCSSVVVVATTTTGSSATTGGVASF
jgi:hypothetical protein